MGQTGANNAKVCATKVCATKVCATKLGPPCWTLNACFVALNSVWVHLGMFCYDIKLGAKWANLVQLKQKFVPQSLARNSQNECSRSTYWTLSSCFHAFLSIWVHLGPFRYHAKLKAKRAKLVQLMQKFVPQSHLGIFCNKCI